MIDVVLSPLSYEHASGGVTVLQPGPERRPTEILNSTLLKKEKTESGVPLFQNTTYG